MRNFYRFCGLIILLGSFLSIQAKDIYVSTIGSNDNNGSKDFPVADLYAARDLIRQFLQTGQFMNEPIVVWIADGNYELTQPLVLSNLDSGSRNFPIVWRAIPGDNVRISGGKNIFYQSFEPVKNKEILSRLPEASRSQVVQIDLLKAGITDWGTLKQYGHALPVTEAPIELIFNDSIMTLSRYPNIGYMPIGKVIDKGSQPMIGDYSNRGGSFHYTDKRHEKWTGLPDVWFQGTFRYGFADASIPVKSINKRNRIVTMALPYLYGIESGANHQHYFAKNILEEIDMPGEWYLDRKTGILYFWPLKKMSKNDRICLSMLEEPIICLEGVKHINLEDLIIENGRGIGVYLENAEHVTIKGCTVRNVGTSGIFMGMGSKQTVPYLTHKDYEGVPISRHVGSLQKHIYKYTTWNRNSGTNNRVISCNIYNTGTGGIYLSGGDKKTLTRGNCVVENCRISSYNRRNKFWWAGINVDGCGNSVRHCEIFNSDWQGIYTCGNEHLFEFNEIHHVTLNSNDTSPWYIGRNPSNCGNVIRYNYFHHCGNKDRMTMGIYCDDSSADVLVYGNVFYKMNSSHGILFSNSGWNLRFVNNIVIEPMASTIYISSHYYTWGRPGAIPTFSENGTIYNRLLKQVNIYEPPYADKYPFLCHYMDEIIDGQEWEGMRCRNNIAKNNVIIGGPEQYVIKDHKYSQCNVIENLRLTEDPGFVDYEHENFNLRRDSKIFKMLPAFKNIPFEEMGVIDY